MMVEGEGWLEGFKEEEVSLEMDGTLPGLYWASSQNTKSMRLEQSQGGERERHEAGGCITELHSRGPTEQAVRIIQCGCCKFRVDGGATLSQPLPIDLAFSLYLSPTMCAGSFSRIRIFERFLVLI